MSARQHRDGTWSLPCRCGAMSDPQPTSRAARAQGKTAGWARSYERHTETFRCPSCRRREAGTGRWVARP